MGPEWSLLYSQETAVWSRLIKSVPSCTDSFKIHFIFSPSCPWLHLALRILNCDFTRIAECSAMLLGEFDIALDHSTIFGVGQFSWTAWPWRWKLCDCVNHQQPLNNAASHPSRLEPVVHLRWHGSVSIWASLMIEYGDVIMWSRRWWQTCGVSGGKL